MLQGASHAPGVAFALLLVAVTVQARDISGRISDSAGRPVARAHVEVASTGTAARSNPKGEFQLVGVPEERFAVLVTALDFQPMRVEVAPDTTELEVEVTQLAATTASIEVVASAEDLRAIIPGSVQVLGRQELVSMKPIDANEALRRVPGLNLREDSGPVAMRLNVGMRGLNPNRSRKVLMLEDGIPIALAPYGEPDMYYSPPIERISRVEILKGSGQIVHGPQTVGGVLNFVSPDPPSRLHGEFDVEGGQRGLFVGWGELGGSNRDQSIGWVATYLHKQGDGWRQFYYDIEDAQVKFNLKPSDRHAIAIKGGLYDEASNSTYLGITTPMFLSDPNQNPVPSDTLAVERRSAALSHAYTISPTAVLSSAVFYYNTERFWGRQDFDRSDRGRNYLGVFGDPSVPGGAVFLRDSAGNRNRSFHVYGAQSNYGLQHRHGMLQAGVRYLIERAHDQRVNGSGFNARTGTIRDDEFRYGRAFAGYVQNRFNLGSRVTFTPGVRFVHYNQERHITRKRVSGEPTNVDLRNSNGVTTAIPGLGLSVRAADDLTFFTGVHRGFAPPATKIAITSTGENLELDSELSWNYEAGVRLAGRRTVSAEFTFFRMDFSNQIISAAESGGATTTITNGGATLHQGFESSARVHWDRIANLAQWSVFTDFRHTHLPVAEFTDNAVYGGNRLPYAPEHLFGATIGVRQFGGLSFLLDLNTVGNQFGDNRQTIEPTPDGTIGQLPSYQVANLTIGYEVGRERWMLEPYFTIKNAFDELYIASRAPQGIQPGLFRQVNGGVRISF